jgi:hypothetical protein
LAEKEPYVTVEEINDFFGTNKSSSTGKSKVIRDLLNLAFFEDEFSTAPSKENNPFDRMITRQHLSFHLKRKSSISIGCNFHNPRKSVPMPF